ncbi:MAG TPA: hypothetical protein PKE45_23335, partial [Caldilineaceae bacterium]|nr:hypothetical protein [Caldilineaceae bacterium]
MRTFHNAQRVTLVASFLITVIGLVAVLLSPPGAQQVLAATPGEGCLAGAGLWANATTQDDILRIGGRKNSLLGGVHSNHTLRIDGEQQLITGAVTYVTSFADTGKDNQYPQPEQVAPLPPPWQLDRALFEPEGAVARIANQAGLYHFVDGNLSVDQDKPLSAGLYYVTGNVKVKTSGAVGKVTVVAAGKIQAELTHANWEPALGGLLFVSYAGASAKQAIELDLNDSSPYGLVYAPGGAVKLTGKSALLSGMVLADRIDLRGSELSVVFTAALCQGLAELPVGGAPTPPPSPDMTDLPLSTPSATPSTTSTPPISPTPTATSIPPTAPAPAT